MDRTYATRLRKAVARPVARDFHGRQMHNKILLALPNDEYTAIFSKLQFASLPTPTVLNEVAEPIRFAFFLNEGLASILSITADGKSVEVGLCGREGFVGVPLTAGFHSSPTRVIMQVRGQWFPTC
jgi:hypothetical protein